MRLWRRLRGTKPVLGALVLANIAAWGWAFVAFQMKPALLAIAAIAWMFGLRHAVDADHIAAIDNAVRKLMRDGQGPGMAGLFFSLGHSTVVVVLAALVAAAAVHMRDRINGIASIGGVVGTVISVMFLMIMAASNLMALRQDRMHAHPPAGVLARLLRPAFAIVRRPRDMYVIGFLFGLGFDTASEIALLGLSASAAAHGLAFWRSMALPALFAVGMSLIDTGDSMVMARAYGWALTEPSRRRSYDFVLTGISAVIALLVGLIELAGLSASGGVIAWLSSHWSGMGGAICLILLFAWLVLLLRRRAATHA